MSNLADLRIAIYARYSSAQQRESSIEDQIHLCKEWIVRNGGSVQDDLIYTDYAISASSLRRDGFDAMHARIKRRDIDVLVIEKGERLSRDLGDSDRLFKELDYLGVRLIGVSDGVDSTTDGARLNYAFRAVMADHYIENLRAYTLRGLFGQARRGYSTGGLPYGYVSRAVPDPSDPKGDPLGYEILIDDEKQAVVNRIFSMYATGHSAIAIAGWLNGDKVPGPRAHTKHKRGKRGWADTTIREILRNDAYVGVWTFGVRKWRKRPGTNKRTYTKRTNGVFQEERPQLRIIPQELWEAVQTRRQRVAARYATKEPGAAPSIRTAPGRAVRYPFSGVLHCGLCGAVMITYGGSSAMYYRCGDRHKRRTCSNSLGIKEDVVVRILCAEIRAVLLGVGGVKYARQKLAERLGEREREASRKKAGVQRAIGDLEVETDKMIDAIAKGFFTERLGENLKAKEAELGARKRELTVLEAERTQPIPLPTPEEVEAKVFDLETLLRAAPVEGREALLKLFKDGRIVMHPQPADGTYIAEGQIDALAVRFLLRLQNAETRLGAGSRGSSIDDHGCAGWI